MPPSEKKWCAMAQPYPTPRLSVAGVPLHAMIDPFPIACFTGALITDIAYANTANVQWVNFSAWLLAFGVATGALSALFGMIDLWRRKPGERSAAAWWHMGGALLLLAIALVNNFVHARDGWTSVVPLGLTLSAITFALMLVSGFIGHRMVYARRPEYKA